MLLFVFDGFPPNRVYSQYYFRILGCLSGLWGVGLLPAELPLLAGGVISLLVFSIGSGGGRYFRIFLAANFSSTSSSLNGTHSRSLQLMPSIGITKLTSGFKIFTFALNVQCSLYFFTTILDMGSKPSMALPSSLILPINCTSFASLKSKKVGFGPPSGTFCEYKYQPCGPGHQKIIKNSLFPKYSVLTLKSTTS